MSETKVEPKQVIIARRDLNMSPGKLAAQVAHASLGAVTDLLEWDDPVDGDKGTFEVAKLVMETDSPLDKWLAGRFTKIVVEVYSEMELLMAYEAAVKSGLNAKLILDSGLTEFNNVPTYTCVAIGPELPEVVDKITGKLKLYGG